MARNALTGVGLMLVVAATVGCKASPGCGASGSCPSAGERAGDRSAPAEMMMSSKSLYDRLGGEPAVRAVVDDFVARAAGDPMVNFTRRGTVREWEPSPQNVEHLKMGLRDFVCVAAGGPCQYKGADMRSVHRGMKITDAEFNALAADLKASLDKFNVPAKEQGELLAAVEGTRKDIVAGTAGY